MLSDVRPDLRTHVCGGVCGPQMHVRQRRRGRGRSKNHAFVLVLGSYDEEGSEPSQASVGDVGGIADAAVLWREEEHASFLQAKGVEGVSHEAVRQPSLRAARVCVEYLSLHKEAALVVDSGATRLGTLPIQRAERLRKHLYRNRAEMCV